MGQDLTRRTIIFGVILLAALLFLAPTFMPDKMPSQWISRPISLGLDLKGGVHLVYEVDVDEAVKSRLQGIANALKTELRKESAGKIPVVRAAVGEQNKLEMTLLNDRQLEAAKEAVLRGFREITFEEVRKGEQERVVLVYGASPAQAEKIEREAVSQAVETLRNRVDQFGVSEPVIQKIGNKRILLQMPGVSDVQGVKKVVGSVAKLEFRLIPTNPNAENVVTMKGEQDRPIKVEDVPLMTGDAVESARVSPGQGKVEVGLTLTSDGARTFRRITTENVGRQLAIILDGVVRSSPTINEPIPNGQASISGFNWEEARQLAVVLRAGALPAPLHVMEERTVGPSLGRESIEKGFVAIIIGFVAIALFMMVYYKKSGVVAVGSLAVNLLLLLAGLSAFGATLTLPGIAGLALTIGMAVDFSVLIFERIRDEQRNGSGRDAAVVGGFDKAFSAILDSNITTLLAGVILLYLGTGPIRGFAVTLCLGIFTTIFTSVFVTRWAFDSFRLQDRNGQLSV